MALDTALMLYLLYEAPPEEQNLETVLYMLENGGASEEDEAYRSPLDLLFEALEDEAGPHRRAGIPYFPAGGGQDGPVHPHYRRGAAVGLCHPGDQKHYIP